LYVLLLVNLTCECPHFVDAHFHLDESSTNHNSHQIPQQRSLRLLYEAAAHRSRLEDETKRITTFLLYAEGAAETVIRSSPVGCCARGMPHHRPHQWRDTGRQVLSVCFGAESKNLIVRAPLKKSDCVCVCYRWQDVLKDPECQCKPASPECVHVFGRSMLYPCMQVMMHIS